MKTSLLLILIISLFACTQKRNDHTAKISANQAIPYPVINSCKDTLALFLGTDFDHDFVEILNGENIVYKDTITSSYTIGIASVYYINGFCQSDSANYKIKVNNLITPLKLSREFKYNYISLKKNTISNDRSKYAYFLD
ncbi:MAG: hypothetical protein JWP12_210 [Bacteroidetes bacterium]|nr:hypothetical protein [Bacteroidota bacterium]